MDVLVVEDDPVIGKSLHKGLGEAGHACTWVKDGGRGLDLALSQRFDAVVLDQMLPGESGLNVLARLRQQGVATPVIVLTALGSVEDRVAGLRAGADDYVVKPFALVEYPEIPRLTVRVGCSMQSLHEDFDILTRMMVLAGSAIAVLAPLGGYWLAGRATRPLARIIQTTARLRPTNLAERLPLRGTGDELDRLSRTINGMLDRIGAYVAENHDYLANAAHELRSPLTAIRSAVEVAMNSERSPQEYQELLGEIAEVCNALGVVVNQLLLLGESESRRLVPEGRPVALELVVQKAVNMFQGAAENQQLELTLSRRDQATVEGDEGHLWQVVNNLIDNALKFTPAGGKVDVSLRADASAGRAVLQVRDTGVGIAAADLRRVFDRFFQCERQGERGTGLGLSICQALVKAHQGTIRAESTPGMGSCFTVTLPLAGSRDEAAAL